MKIFKRIEKDLLIYQIFSNLRFGPQYLAAFIIIVLMGDYLFCVEYDGTLRGSHFSIYESHYESRLNYGEPKLIPSSNYNDLITNIELYYPCNMDGVDQLTNTAHTFSKVSQPAFLEIFKGEDWKLSLTNYMKFLSIISKNNDDLIAHITHNNNIFLRGYNGTSKLPYDNLDVITAALDNVIKIYKQRI
uniref:Uncharacterized protein n=1 Tax=Heterostelium pallidum TaxID=13642 RepID=B2XX33_HETPA|nr:hypothetical protein [Heterostelium pallidum]